MVAVLKAAGREIGQLKRAVFKRAADASQPVELQRNFVLTEKQYEQFDQCMSNPEQPTEAMLQAHQKLKQFLQQTSK